jgi:transposase
MATVNNSYSIPAEEFKVLEKIREDCKQVIEDPNLTEIVRVAIYNLSQEKEPKDISKTLYKLGRKSPGRPAKEFKEKTTEVGDFVDFSVITDVQWELIKNLFKDKTQARKVLSDIIFDLQNIWRRSVKKNYKTSKTTAWRTLQKWQDNGIWAEIYHRLSRTYNDKQKAQWDKVFLNSYIHKRKQIVRTISKSRKTK